MLRLLGDDAGYVCSQNLCTDAPESAVSSVLRDLEGGGCRKKGLNGANDSRRPNSSLTLKFLLRLTPVLSPPHLCMAIRGLEPRGEDGESR